MSVSPMTISKADGEKLAGDMLETLAEGMLKNDFTTNKALFADNVSWVSPHIALGAGCPPRSAARSAP